MLDRRTVVATVLCGALAGCTTDTDGNGDTPEPTPSETPTPTATPSSTPDGSGTGIEEWMADVGNFDGVMDLTGQASVSVQVGAKGNGGNLAFAPPAIAVVTGTTVTWEWLGKGGSHNVVATDGAFESDLTATQGYTFDHTFDTKDTYKYYCQPHKPLGMKGIVIVR